MSMKYSTTSIWLTLAVLPLHPGNPSSRRLLSLANTLVATRRQTSSSDMQVLHLHRTNSSPALCHQLLFLTNQIHLLITKTRYRCNLLCRQCSPLPHKGTEHIPKQTLQPTPRRLCPAVLGLHAVKLGPQLWVLLQRASILPPQHAHQVQGLPLQRLVGNRHESFRIRLAPDIDL